MMKKNWKAIFLGIASVLILSAWALCSGYGCGVAGFSEFTPWFFGGSIILLAISDWVLSRYFASINRPWGRKWAIFYFVGNLLVSFLDLYSNWNQYLKYNP